MALAATGFVDADETPPADRLPADRSTEAAEGEDETPGQKQLFSGKVVLLTEALRRRGIRATGEMAGQVVLETAEGELLPILANWRGGAFFQDERLRDRRVELVGTLRPGVPYVQVLMIFTFEDGQRQYTDYWCDVCSIPMYEIKPCECCQEEIRLRFQKQDLPEYLRSASSPGVRSPGSGGSPAP